MVSERDAFRIAALRAKVMAEAAAARPGSMCALLGGEPEASEVCSRRCARRRARVRQLQRTWSNCYFGDVAAVDRAVALWKERPRHKASMLATSGAFHSPLMQPAGGALAEFLEEVEFHEARTPLVCNVDARPLSAADARAHLASQVVSPVLFEQSVHWLSEQGVDTFVECGFGGVLTKLVKRIESAAARFAPVSPEEIAQVASEVACGGAE